TTGGGAEVLTRSTESRSIVRRNKTKINSSVPSAALVNTSRKIALLIMRIVNSVLTAAAVRGRPQSAVFRPAPQSGPDRRCRIAEKGRSPKNSWRRGRYRSGQANFRYLRSSKHRGDRKRS